jgi:PKHD-type hydroxylase
MMLHIPEVLTRPQVMEVRKIIDAADWIDGKASVGPQGARVKKNRQLPESSAIGMQVGQAILKTLVANSLFVAAALPVRYMPPLFNRYEGGEHYGFHVDGAIRNIPGSNLSLRTDLSCTLFLSEPNDYDGGELVVVDTYGEHEVKLPAGDMILYPASSVHKVEPVTRGTRISSFFWVQSMVADDGRRSLLFELDQNIQKLRAKLGDSEEVVGLTGHYHNLLRQWAQV